VVRLAWTIAALLTIAAGVLYVSDPSTTNWYLYFLGAAPLVVLSFLRLLALQKRNPQSKVGPGGGAGASPSFLEPPPP